MCFLVMLLYGMSLGCTRLARRTSCGSMFSSRATASTISSRAKHTPVRATPRYGRIGGLLVATDQVRQRKRSILYGPGRIELTCAPSRHAENGYEEYAPESTVASQSMPRILPLASAYMVMS